jgi:prepilin peptidase CpaA
MTLLLFTPYITIAGFIGLLLASAYSDVKQLIIPNRYCIAIALLFPAYGLAAPQAVDWVGSALVGSIALAIGFLMFCKKWAGGGDVKLFAATALWAGPALIVPFVLYTGLAGGAIAGFLWLRHRLTSAGTPLTLPLTPATREFYQQPMPYGVAIAVGGIYVAFTILGLW